MTEKRIKDLERRGRNQGIIAMVCYGFAIVLIITSLITSDKEANSLGILCWLLGFVFSTQSYQSYNDRRVAILEETFNKMVDILTAEDKGAPEEESEADTVEDDTKETVIVSPEDFERFKRGEMTKEELLGIKKAVDKVTEAKMKNE